MQKGELKTKDIVQTDEFGNVIGNSSTEQWNAKPFTQSFDNDLLIQDWNFYIENVYNGDTNLVPQYNCPLPAELEIIAFPNPVSDIEDLRVRIISSKAVCMFDFSYLGLVGLSGGRATGELFANNISECKNEFVIKPAGQINFPTDDMEITVRVITEDGCVYVASGNVLVD